MLQRPPAATIPDAPGSYQFKDEAGRVIYVGKARSLRQRLSNYFQNPAQLHPRTAQMVATAAGVEWIQVRNEVEALMLEFSLIKEHRPRFNIRLVDDKSYPFLAVTVSDEWPRPMVMRGAKRKGVRYFGPYAHAYAIRETLDLLLRTFPLRTCSDAKFGRHHRMGRPCLLYHIEKCSGPCVGEVDAEAYAAYVEDLLEFLGGDTDAVVARLERQMRAAADELEYERAARVRDRLASVRKAIEKQQIVGDRSEDIDVIGLAEDDLEAAVQVFFVRKGRVVGRRGFVIDKVEALDRSQLVGNILEGLYYDEPAAGYPKVVLCCDLPDDPDLYETWLTEQRANAAVDGRQRAGRVQIRVPQRGDKRELLATVTRNAEEEFVRHRLRRASDINARSKALEELQDALGLPIAPLRIECYDNSHLGGTDYVSSMVVFEDGLPAKGQYRRFRLRNVPGNDDFAAMEEVLTRRLTQLPGGPGPAAGRAGPLPVPAPAAHGRRRQGPAGRGHPGAGGAGPGRRDPGLRAGQGVRGGLPARPERPDPPAPPLRGAVPAAAAAGRVAPLRHHLPAPAPQQADDQGLPRRDPRPRPHPAQAARQGARRCLGGAPGVARAAAGAALAARCGGRGDRGEEHRGRRRRQGQRRGPPPPRTRSGRPGRFDAGLGGRGGDGLGADDGWPGTPVAVRAGR